MRGAVVFAIVLSAGVAARQGEPTPAAGLAPVGAQPAEAPERADFAGLWRYNEAFSIDMATGRPERAARGASAPRAPRPDPPAPEPRAAGPQAGAGAEREVFGISPFARSPRALREHRDMVRDLMEIAETLDFTLTDAAVTIVDDLERSRTYPTSGGEHGYRLGASDFRARVSWEGARLVREIEGTFGFHMDETYFLGPGADQLFIIMRVEGVTRGRPPVGADRVYDRVLSEQP